MHERRVAIARYLTDRGPVWGEPAAEALGLSLKDWWAAVGSGGLFDMVRGGWAVSAAGKQELLGG